MHLLTAWGVVAAVEEVLNMLHKVGGLRLIALAGINYTVGVDSNAIKGLDLGSDTVLVEQPLYVDADTLKFNVDSSGLVKDVMRSSDSVYIKINGVWEFAFIGNIMFGKHYLYKT